MLNTLASRCLIIGYAIDKITLHNSSLHGSSKDQSKVQSCNFCFILNLLPGQLTFSYAFLDIHIGDLEHIATVQTKFCVSIMYDWCTRVDTRAKPLHVQANTRYNSSDLLVF